MKKRSATTRSRSRRRAPYWARYSDEQLLDLRLCDLHLSLKGSAIEKHIARLYRELEHRGIRFKPHVWLADEWFSPDGVPGFAIPFYLAHPRLMRLERKMMQEVEGGNVNWLMRILRHETGHALDTAYRLRRHKEWREVFGKASRPYPTSYRPRPTSKRFVLHLGHWYAQTHPTEDFAETFAVWLQPRSQWRSDYAEWPALDKLNYVDMAMRELQRRKPVVAARDVIEPLRENTRTLRQHYRREVKRFAVEITHVYDKVLLRTFRPLTGRAAHAMSASQLLRESRPQLLRTMRRHAGMHPYLIHNVVRTIIERCRELNLTAQGSRRENKRAALRLMERIVFDMIYRRRQLYVL
jgi:hypothetical protein